MKLKEYLDKNNIEYVIAADGALSVGGSLDLRGTSITALPDGLSVGGSLDLEGTSITALPDGLSVGGSLDLGGTSITALPDGLSVGGSLDLGGTSITALPDGLSVGGSLDLRGTSITALPDGLSVGGYLDLGGTSITALPDGLSVGGSLDLRGTSITALPDGLSVGGYLYLEGTSITALPDGLSVGGSLDLRGTSITALPDGLSVGGYLYLEGTSITALPDGLSCEELYFNGTIGDYVFSVIDGIFCIIICEKKKDDISLKKCRKSEFKDGKVVGDTFFVASNKEYNAHGETIREAIEELRFKSSDRDLSEFKNLTLDTQKTPQEWSFVYRMVTGACRYGTSEFMRGRALKARYTLKEIIAETENAYAGSEFKAFFKEAA